MVVFSPYALKRLAAAAPANAVDEDVTLMPFGKYKGMNQRIVAQYHPHYYLMLCQRNIVFSEDKRDPKAVAIARQGTNHCLDDGNDWGLAREWGS